MTKLRDGSSLLLARRDDGYVVTAVGPGLEPQLLGEISPDQLAALAGGDVSDWADQLGDHASGGEPCLDDPVTRERLAEQDQMFGGWLPGIADAEAERLARVETRAARQRLHSSPRLARPTLPISVVRRAALIESLGPKRVIVDDDADGLCLVLAEAGIEVLVVESDPVRRLWLEQEAELAGVVDAVSIVGGASDDSGDGSGSGSGNGTQTIAEFGKADLAVVSVGPPHLTHRALAWACDTVVPGGHILAGLRAPWDVHFFRDLPTTGLEIEQHLREIDVPTLPGGYVLDGAGDQILLARPPDEKLTLAPPPDAPADRVREQPYYWLDFDELAAARLTNNPLERLIDLIAAQHGVPEAMRTVSKSDDRELIAWFDRDGVGISAQLATQGRHLLVTMIPYDPGLEYTVMSAVFHLLGDHLTRMRPQLATLWRGESIVA